MLRVRRIVVGVLVIAGSAVAMAVIPSSPLAFPQGGGSETVNGSAPADGAEITHTDALPANATQGSITVQPLSGDDLKDFDAMIGAVVDTFPHTQKLSKKSQATLGCVLMAYLPLASKPEGHAITVADLSLQAAMLDICLQLAQSLPGPARDHAAAAKANCGRIDTAVTVRITHSHSGYHVTTVGPTRNNARRRLSISCRHSGKGLLIGVKPRKRGQTLPHAGAPELGIAYSNRSTKTLRIRTTFTAN